MRECQDSQVLFDYLQQELRPDQAARIEAHLPHCAACRDELDQLRRQIQEVKTTLAQLDPAPGRQPKPNPDLVRLRARPDSLLPFPHPALGCAVAVVLILCVIVQPGGKQSAMADSISRLKVLMDISATLNRASSMDCSMTMPGIGGEKSYHIRWNAKGITRVDRKSTEGIQQTMWISGSTVPPDPVWQPAMELLTPAILARNLEGPYGLMQTGLRDAAGPGEFLLVGRENQQTIEITVDGRTYLPKKLKKYSPGSETGVARNCVLEVQLLWNRPIPKDLLIPRPAAGK